MAFVSISPTVTPITPQRRDRGGASVNIGQDSKDQAILLALLQFLSNQQNAQSDRAFRQAQFEENRKSTELDRRQAQLNEGASLTESTRRDFAELQGKFQQQFSRAAEKGLIKARDSVQSSMTVLNRNLKKYKTNPTPTNRQSVFGALQALGDRVRTSAQQTDDLFVQEGLASVLDLTLVRIQEEGLTGNEADAFLNFSIPFTETVHRRFADVERNLSTEVEQRVRTSMETFNERAKDIQTSLPPSEFGSAIRRAAKDLRPELPPIPTTFAQDGVPTFGAFQADPRGGLLPTNVRESVVEAAADVGDILAGTHGRGIGGFVGEVGTNVAEGVGQLPFLLPGMLPPRTVPPLGGPSIPSGPPPTRPPVSQGLPLPPVQKSIAPLFSPSDTQATDVDTGFFPRQESVEDLIARMFTEQDPIGRTFPGSPPVDFGVRPPAGPTPLPGGIPSASVIPQGPEVQQLMESIARQRGIGQISPAVEQEILAAEAEKMAFFLRSLP